ncbi:MAG TPA: hypothetical protein ENI17_14270 [Pseudomonas xinjiangensis]|uniref:Uncharacterized protein n=1 Tax=Halopseudomonas xinjiangensis TaxID=487184 RepID=A0A7V1BQH1_9GAMM|nr:hypothetical protein [Halopseudomonas xinjiangensis]HEC48773.1 hypothetical protein [Halopseudomonas xinjiangensis]
MKTQRASTQTINPETRDAVGYLIDEHGREIAITEQMIQLACAKLEQHWMPASAAPQAARA